MNPTGGFGFKTSFLKIDLLVVTCLNVLNFGSLYIWTLIFIELTGEYDVTLCCDPYCDIQAFLVGLGGHDQK